MKTPLALTLIGMFTASVSALPLYDPFADATGSGGTSYAVGANLVGQTDAAAHSWFGAGPTTGTPVTPTIISGSIAIPGLSLGEGNSIRMVPGAGPSPRLSLGTPFLAANSSIYYSFAFNVNTLGNLSTSGAFFAGFNNTFGSQTTTPSVVGARLYLRRVGTSGFNIGISKTGTTSADWYWDTTLYNVNQDLFVVGRYSYGAIGASMTDDSASLWINPSVGTFGDASPPTPLVTGTTGTDLAQNTTNAPIQSFVFMQRTTGNQPDVLFVDELRVGTSWADVTTVPEPSFLALGGFGALALVAGYRARRR